MAKFVFVTGGVVSSPGKGITTAGHRGEAGPFLNVDAGTMNPFQHGEVFVTVDGGEAALDLGPTSGFSISGRDGPTPCSRAVRAAGERAVGVPG